jgi:hypothetical protein
LRTGPFLNLQWLFRDNLIRRMNYTLTRPIIWKMPSGFISANLSVELKDGSGALIGPEKHQRTSDCPVLANDRFAP